MNHIRITFIRLFFLSAMIVIAPSATRADGISKLFGGSHVQPGWNRAAPPYPSASMFPQYPSSCGKCGSHGDGHLADYGGVATGPSWYDFSIDAVYLDRGISGKSDVDLVSDNPTDTTIVLGVSNADFEHQTGIRATVRYQLNATDNIEGSYLDALDWDTSVTINDSDVDEDVNDLFSAFSQFGIFPVQGFLETDQAATSSIRYRTNLESAEVNWRRTWIARNHRIHGSYLFGFRYFRINESFNHAIRVNPATAPTFVYDIRTGNDMLGLQGGTQLGWCVLPGLIAHGEIKGGIYGNGGRQNSTISTPDLSLAESAKDDVASFATDASAWMTWQVHPLVKIRVGYEFLLFQDVVLAPDNFNPTPPNLTTTDPDFVFPARQVTLDDQGEAFYHGARLGLEVGW